MDNRSILFLFPGLWGNNTSEIVRWWFRIVIRFFENKYEVIPITYDGGSLKDFVTSSLWQINPYINTGRPIYAIGYSIGGQVIRGVHAQKPHLFKAVALLSGLENFGMRVEVLMQSLMVVLWTLVRCLLTGTFRFGRAHDVEHLFLGDTINQTIRRDLIEKILKTHGHEESRAAILQAAMPGWRVHFPGLGCPTAVVVPLSDFFIARATYRADNIQGRYYTGGDHSFFIQSTRSLDQLLQTTDIFFDSHS